MRNETVIIIHIVGDEDPVIHEMHEAVGHFGKQWCLSNHVVCDAGELHDLGGYGPLRVEQGVSLPDDLMISDFDRSDFCNAVA